jgi:hypothetical protein
LDQNSFHALVKRVVALETAVGINRNNPPAPPDVPTTMTDSRLSKPALARRWGVSCRSVDRRREEPGFPEPEIVSHRCYWWLSAIIRYERKTAASSKS